LKKGRDSLWRETLHQHREFPLFVEESPSGGSRVEIKYEGPGGISEGQACEMFLCMKFKPWNGEIRA
jgi:hypothetical protein